MKKILVSGMAILFIMVILAGCAQQPTETVAETTPMPAESTDTPAPTQEPTPEPVGPLTGSQIRDGVYAITVTSSSSMFRIVDAQLTVENGKMTAVLTMSGQGYGMLYMGTGEQALADEESSYIPFVLDDDGAKTFTVPVTVLNQEVDCAAWSIKKETWYDRVLVFQSEEIPADAILSE